MLDDTMNDPNEDLLNTRQAAAVLHLSPTTLATWRCCKRYALPYTRAGKKVLYRRGDLLAFLNKNRVEITPRRSR
jgi:hypothetical protein